jgi:hypothetical protein
MRIPYISLLAAGALALGGCAYGDVGLGMGYGGYGGYYGSGYGYPYGPYGGYGTYPGYYGGFGYGTPYYGWYDNSYYPGTGVYVYDSYRRPHVWNDRQRHYWTTRDRSIRTSGTVTTRQQNWSGFDRHDRHSRSDRTHD